MICPWCGEEEVLDLFEMWTEEHAFMLETCCYASHESVVAQMADDPEWASRLLRSLGAEVYAGMPLRRVADGDGRLLLDWGLSIRPIGRAEAMAFIKRHHEHNGPLSVDRFRAAAWNGSTLLGVVVVGNPTTPSLMNRGWVEVRRLCLSRSVPAALRWKACSALYGWAAAEAERQGWRRIITYTLASESGMSLRYARWKREGAASREGATWSRRGPGRVEGPTGEKVRWAKALKPRSPRMVQTTFAFPRQMRRAQAAEFA